MRRLAFTYASLFCCLALSTASYAQAKKPAAPKKDATPATAPAQPSEELLRARMRPPVHGVATIDIIKGASKKVGNDVVTITKVKNTSDAPIAGLRLDEWWYAGQQQVSGGTDRLRQPLAPGEIAELKTVSPWKTGMTGSQLQFTHANGQIKPTAVKSFDAKPTAKKKK